MTQNSPAAVLGAPPHAPKSRTLPHPATQARACPPRGWRTRQLPLPRARGPEWQGGHVRTLDAAGLADDLFGEVRAGDALLYLLRRFSASTWASDPDKEVACYWLSTPDPDVCLIISLRREQAQFMAGATIPLWEAAMRAPGQPGAETVHQERIRTALWQALLDLRRDVLVDDQELAITPGGTPSAADPSWLPLPAVAPALRGAARRRSKPRRSKPQSQEKSQ